MKVDIDLDDVAESFLGALVAGLVILLLARTMTGQRSRWRLF